MDNNQYHSQPPPKVSTSILSKWRRPKNNTGSTSSTSQDQPIEIPPFVQPQNVNEDRQVRRRWAIPDDVHENWSKDVVEFFNKGDSSFCYSAVFYNLVKLDKRFWGTLLGCINPIHLTATVFFLKHKPFNFLHSGYE